MIGAGSAEGLEQRRAVRAFPEAPFRVPLHRQREGGRPGDAHRLDQPVGRYRFDRQAIGQPVDRLGMDRVDADLPLPVIRSSSPPGVRLTEWTLAYCSSTGRVSSALWSSLPGNS